MRQPPTSLIEAIRVQRGWRQIDLADAAGVSQWTISQLEDGVRDLEPLAEAIARSLNIPADLLAQPAAGPMIGHALQASLPRAARNQLLASITMAHVHVRLLLGPTSASFLRDPDGVAHPHEFAERLRRRWDLPVGPVKRLIPTLEAHGVVCIYRDLSAIRVSALMSTTEQGQTLLFLDTSATRVELAEAIAHELGHKVIDDNPLAGSESDAESFAVGFLMPEKEVLGDETLSPALDLASAATAWGVSPRTLASRLRELRRVTDIQLRALIREAKVLGAGEGRRSLLGAPSMLADAVRSAGGSHHAAPKALITTEQLRRDYLARSGS